MTDRINLTIDTDPDLSLEVRDELARSLMIDLRDIPRADVSIPRASKALPGAKSGTIFAVGTLAVSLPSLATVRLLVQIVSKWLERSKARRITITDGRRKIEIDAMSVRDEHALVDMIISTMFTHTESESDVGESQ